MNFNNSESVCDRLYDHWLLLAADGSLKRCSISLREKWSKLESKESRRQLREFFGLSETEGAQFYASWIEALKGSASVTNLRFPASDEVVRKVVMVPQFCFERSEVSVLVAAVRSNHQVSLSQGAELAENNARLEKRLQEVEAENHAANEQLSALRLEKEFLKKEKKGRLLFLSELARTVFTPFDSLNELRDRILKVETKSEDRELLEGFLQRCEGSSDLLKLFREYLEVELEPVDLSSEEVFLGPVFQALKTEFHSVASRRTLDVDFGTLPSSEKLAVGDEKLLKRLLSNLWKNSVELSKLCAVSLLVEEVENVSRNHIGLRFRLILKEGSLRCEKNNLIFNPLVINEKKTRTFMVSTSVGLGVCRKLCEQMGGKFDVRENSNGEGYVFSFEIHLREKIAESVANLDQFNNDFPPRMEETKTLPTGVAVRGSEKDSEPLRLLVVDDNPNNLLITSKLSQHLGYVAETVTNGVEALSTLQEGSFDIVLMDIRMAPINGIETTQKIRLGEAGEQNSRAYIIAVTAHALQGDREKCIDSGMNDYLSKPLTLDRLKDSLNRARSELSLD